MPRNELVFKTIQNRVWALHPAKLEEMYLFFDRILAGEKVEFPAAATGRSGGKAEDTYEIRDGVAILPVYGIIDKRMNMFMKFSGGTSTELLARDFRQALSDPLVKAILLDVDSPGGSVDGTKELADLVLAARAEKPVLAYANGLMASAAYWIGAGALTILAPETAEIGSIGVALMHYDYSAADAKEGVKRTAITGGEYKRIASDEKPLSKEGQEYLQAMVNDYYAIFLDGVAAARNSDPKTVHERMADGRIFVGKKALQAGLIDQIGYIDNALAMARAKGGAMPKNITKTQLAEENPELYALIKSEGAGEVSVEQLLSQHPEAAEKLRAAGIDQERTRVVKILTRAGLPGLTLGLIQDGATYETALETMVNHLDQMRAEGLKTLGAQAPPAVGSEAPKVETHTETSTAPIETRAKAKWDADPKLQEEFLGKFETYLAWFRSEEAGLNKVVKKA